MLCRNFIRWPIQNQHVSVEAYCERCKENKLPTSLTTRFSLRQRMLYYLFWTAYSTKNKSQRFWKLLWCIPKKCLWDWIELSKAFRFSYRRKRYLHDDFKRSLLLSLLWKFLYTFLYWKMWGILREEAFPEKIEL